MICEQDGFKTKAAVKAHATRQHGANELTYNEHVDKTRGSLTRAQETPMTAKDIVAMRTEKDWLDCIDHALLSSGIVPTSNNDYPAGMDRVEAVEHLIKLVKRSHPSPSPEPPLTASEAYDRALDRQRNQVVETKIEIRPATNHERVIEEFEQAVRDHEMMGSKDPEEHAQIEGEYLACYRNLRIYLRLLKERASQAEWLEKEILS